MTKFKKGDYFVWVHYATGKVHIVGRIVEVLINWNGEGEHCYRYKIIKNDPNYTDISASQFYRNTDGYSHFDEESPFVNGIQVIPKYDVVGYLV